MVVLIVGVVLSVVGVLGIFLFEGWAYLGVVIRGSVPLMFFVFGLAAIAVGVSSVRDKVASAQDEEKKEE